MDFTRGDTFSYSGPVTAMVNGVPVADMTGWEAASQVRDKNGALLADLEVVWITRAPPVISLTAAAEDTDWPPGKARIDIQFTLPDGRIKSTPVAEFNVTQDVTRSL